MGDDTKTQIIDQVSKERRIDFLEFKNSVLRKFTIAVITCATTVFFAGGAWYLIEHRVDVMADTLGEFPSPGEVREKEQTHKQVHVTENQEVKHVKQAVDEIKKQQKTMAQQVTNTEQNVWKIAQKLGVE